MQVFTGIKPLIEHLRVQGYKYYSPVDTRSLPEGSRIDKLVNRGRLGVFMGYDENTTSYYCIWAPDRQEVIKYYKVTFLENEKWGSTPLNLKVIILNKLPPRRPVSRLRKNTIAASDTITLEKIVAAELMAVEPAVPAPVNTGNQRTPIIEERVPEMIPEDQYIED